MKNLRAIDLNLLVAFHAMMRERNVTRAADRIGLAQPSMSNALARLRALFDDELFVATPKQMRPTRRARELAGPVAEALRQVRLAVNRDKPFDPRTSTRCFRLAGTTNANATGLPPVIEMLQREAPSIDIFIRALTNRQAVQALIDEEIDLAIGVVTELPRCLAVRPLVSDRAVCLARHDHPALRDGLTLKSFVSLPHVRASLTEDPVEDIDVALAHMGLERRFAMIVPSALAIPVVVAHSAMIGVVPEKLARPLAALAGLAVHEIPLDLPHWTLSLVWNRQAETDPGICWLRDRVSSALATSPALRIGGTPANSVALLRQAGDSRDGEERRQRHGSH